MQSVTVNTQQGISEITKNIDTDKICNLFYESHKEVDKIAEMFDIDEVTAWAVLLEGKSDIEMLKKAQVLLMMVILVTLQTWCAEIKLRAEIRAGEMLTEMEKNPGSLFRGNIMLPREETKLEDLGISRIQSHRWRSTTGQRMAASW